jgi:outer membrane autotransporter protein
MGLGEYRSAAGGVMVGGRFFRGLAKGWRRAPGRWLAAPAMLVCLLAAAPAFADCQPDPAATGQTVTCSGVDNNGFAAGVGVNQLTVNVLTGAAVNNLAPGSIAINLNDTNIVTNNGAVAVGDDGTGINAGSGNTITNAATGAITAGNAAGATVYGIFVVDNNIITNFGSIQLGTTTCGCGVVGINANNNNLITNVGPIAGGDLGVGISVVDNNTVVNSGAISFGLGSAGIVGNNNNTITNAAGGTITVGDSFGAGAFGIFAQDFNTVSNFGAIHVGSSPGGLPASGIFAGDHNTILNAGSITGGDIAAGIFVNNRNTITNSGAIVLGQDSVGIAGTDHNVITNSATGTITIGDVVSVAAIGIFVQDNNTITNLGRITVGSSCGCGPLSGIDAGSGNTIVNGGTIVGGTLATGISALDNNTITNSGAITVGDNAPFGPAAGIAVFDGNIVVNAAGATITAGMFGVGITTGDNNSITNNGSINVGALGVGIQLGSANTFINNGTIRAGAIGFSIQTCGVCTSDNVVVNNGTLDGMVDLEGTNHSFTNNGLLTITDPGTPVGNIHIIQGSFVQTAAGTLALRLDNTGAHDALNATTATLGGTLRATVQPGLYGASTFYAGVVTATDPITTTFAQTTTSLAFFTATASYNPNSVDLTLSRIPFGSAPGETQNQRNVGNYLEQNYSTALTGNAAIFFANLLASPSLAVLDRLSGEGTSGTQQTALNAGNMFNQTMLDQALAFLDGGVPGTNGVGAQSTLLQYAATEKAERPEYKAFAGIRPEAGAVRAQPWRAWMTGFGGNQLLRGDSVIGSADTSSRTIGGAGGFDYQVSPGLLLGFAAAGSASDFAVPDRATTGKVDGSHLGVYGIYRWAQAYVAGTLSYSRFDNDTTRSVSGIGPSETARGQFNSDQFGGRLQVGRQFVFDRIAVTPFAAVQYLQLWQRGYTETSVTAAGAPGILGLTFQSRAVSSLPTFLGAQVDTRFVVARDTTLAPFVRASWVHEFMPDRSIAAALGFLPIGNFIVDGPRAASNAARLEAGANLYVARNVALFANFIGEYSKSTSSNGGNGGLRVTW